MESKRGVRLVIALICILVGVPHIFESEIIAHIWFACGVVISQL